MIATLSKETTAVFEPPPQHTTFDIADKIPKHHRTQVRGLHKKIIWLLIKVRIMFLAVYHTRSFTSALNLNNQMKALRNAVWGGEVDKLYKVSGKYFSNQYASAWPSRQYDKFIAQEINRTIKNKLDHPASFIFFGITNKCPLNCEHCLEAHNLNKPETFTREELDKVISHFKTKGVLQMHLTGGETMLRVKDLLPIIATHSKDIDFWILTSGFNATSENLLALRKAGLKGLAVSIDHYIPALHDGFRRKKGSFYDAVNAVKKAQKTGLVTAVSICVTKEFLNGNHLMHYANFAASLNPEFVQILEPKNVGNYKEKNVLLEESHIITLESFFKQINHDKKYSHYPTFSYHGYHQRRLGCFAGSRSMYIDSAGNVHSCPFCHTASYNIKSFLKADDIDKIPAKPNECPRYQKVV